MKTNEFDAAALAARRQRLARALGEGVAVVPTAPERLRNRDTHYPYRFDSHFWYLTAFPEPDAVLVIVAGKAPRSILFCREKNAEREIWDGFRFGPQAASERFGFDEAHPIAALDDVMTKLLSDQPALCYPVGADAAWDARAMKWLNAVREKARAGVVAPARVIDVHALVDEMRLLKDASEIATMRRAAEISAAGHRRAMQTARPGMSEHEIEAELLYEFRRRGAQFPAYGPIVAGGAGVQQLVGGAGDEAVGRADDQRDVSIGLRLTEQQAAIKRPLPGRADQPYEGLIHHRAVEPQIERDDGGGNQPLGRQELHVPELNFGWEQLREIDIRDGADEPGGRQRAPVAERQLGDAAAHDPKA